MKKTGATKKKRNRKRERKKDPPGAKLSEQQLQVLKQRITPRLPRRPIRSGKTILYSGKLDKTWGKPLGKAKWLAEEIRANPSVGWRLVEQERKLRRNVKGYLPQMMQKLGEYLEAEQPVFDTLDYQIVEIVQQNPRYTVKEITAEVSALYPKQKFNTLQKRVRRLLQPLDDKMNYAVANIVKQHPHYSVKEITSALGELYPNQKWDTLEKRIRQLLNPR